MFDVGDILLGKYRLEGEIGRGGMGVVLAARHLELDERVAIKFLSPECTKDPDVVTRFMREARAAARLKSEHVVRVSDVGRLPSGQPYMVMELLEGEDLEGLLQRRGPLPVAEAVDYVLQALEAVAAAHALGIVHRDLKPANLFLARQQDGTRTVKVLDFGISKFIAAGATGVGMTQLPGPMGSPLYMSPEQLVSARDVDVRTDVWAFGVTLHQLLTTALPFGGHSMPQLVAAVLHEPPAPLRAHRPDAHPALEAVIHRALEKQRERRFANVGELAQSLAPFGSPAARVSAERVARLLSGQGAAQLPWAPTVQAHSAPVETVRMGPAGALLADTTSSAWAATPEHAAQPQGVAKAPKKPSHAPIFAGLGLGVFLMLLGVVGAAAKDTYRPIAVAGIPALLASPDQASAPKTETKPRPETKPAPASSYDLVGSYTLSGEGPDKAPYTGTARVEPIVGEMYKITFTVGKDTVHGRAFRDGDVLAVGFSSKPQVGVVSYLVGPDHSLDGAWFGGTNTTLGKEILFGGDEDLTGNYATKTAETPGKVRYDGHVKISEANGQYRLRYSRHGLPLSTFLGIGVREGNVLAVGYSEVGADAGVAAYRITDGGATLEGHWSRSIHAQKGLGFETLHKAE